MAAAAPVCVSSPASGGRTLETPQKGLGREGEREGQRGVEGALILKDRWRDGVTYPRQCLCGSL